MSQPSPRDQLLSHLVTQVGGYNASSGMHTGRFREWEQNLGNDDARIVAKLLEDHRRAVAYPLNEEIKTLKARLFDLTNKP